MPVASEASYLQRKLVVEPNTVSEPINIPALNVPVRMSVIIPAVGHRGICELTIVRAANPAACLMWLGTDTCTSTIRANAHPRPAETIILYADSAKKITVQVASESAVAINNSSSDAVKVVIAFAW